MQNTGVRRCSGFHKAFIPTFASIEENKISKEYENWLYSNSAALLQIYRIPANTSTASATLRAAWVEDCNVVHLIYILALIIVSFDVLFAHISLCFLISILKFSV